MTINGRTLTSIVTDLANISTTEADFRQAITDLATEASSYGKLPGGSFSSMSVFTSSGTWTKPADTDIKYYTVVIIGAGGGAGACADGCWRGRPDRALCHGGRAECRRVELRRLPLCAPRRLSRRRRDHQPRRGSEIHHLV